MTPNDDQIHPLSYPQESLWFLDALGDDAAYNEYEAVRLRGPLDINALRQAANDLVARHDMLRARFVACEGVPHQVFEKPYPLPVPVIDLSSALGDRIEQARLLAAQEARRPFHLDKGGLVRVFLIRLDEHDHVLVVTIHHICGDGWSFGLISRELAAHYRAIRTSAPAEVAELACQYLDYIQWQRGRSEALARQRSYWVEQLKNVAPLLQLPLDHRRPARQQFRGKRVEFDVDAELSAKVRSLAQSQRVTPYMASLAAFFLVLQRYALTDDLMVGTPFANRGERRFESLIGFFANTLVLRADLSGDPTVAELLHRVRKMTLEAYENSEVPFEQVVQAVAPERNLSYNPIFQVMFSWQPGATLADAAFDELEVGSFDLGLSTAKFDINLMIWDSSEGLRGRWEFNSSLLDATTVQRMSEHYVWVLRELCVDPGRHISEVQLFGEAERQAVLQRWPQRETFPDTPAVHERFRGWARKQPNAVAVTFGEEAVTYGELDARAERLAGVLQGRGVKRGDRVAIYMDRTEHLLTAILGVLYTGAAYVPIDPVYPPDRVRSILDSATPVVVVSDQSRANELPELETEPVLVDTPLDGGSYTAQLVTPEDVAYVIFTSGSTGKPKGVVVTHSNVARLFTATAHWYGFSPDDVWTLFHSYAFDVSVWEIWGSLIHGGRLVIVPYLVSRSPEEFLQLLSDEGSTVLSQTPSAFQQLSQAEERMHAPPDLALRVIVFAGEALDFNILLPWFRRHGDAVKMINMYGITETTVHVTYREVTAADAMAGRGSLIGPPMPDLHLVILDEQRRPVPIGVPGELWVGGPGVAREYLGRADLTAENFPPHFLGGTGHLYKSGDLVRGLEDGDIEYLGRIDHQVQLRGFRIELGEIETALTSNSAVADAVVVLRNDTGDPRLVAYIVPAGGRLTVASLREHCRNAVPSYMVPSAWMFLDALPLTANGKADRRALPAPVVEEQAQGQTQPPQTATQRALAEMWRGLLGLRQIGIHDSFFDVGGHSMLAVRLLAQIESELGERLPLPVLFEKPTIAELAMAIDHGATPQSAVVWLSRGEGVPWIALPGSGGMITAFSHLASAMTGPFGVLQRPGLDGSAPLERMEDVVAHHAAAVADLEAVHLIGHSLGAWIAHALASELEHRGVKISLTVLDMPAPGAAPYPATSTADKRNQTLVEIAEALAGDALPNDWQERGLDGKLEALKSASLQHALAGSAADVSSMLAVLEADERMMQEYGTVEVLDGSTTLLRTERFDRDMGNPFSDHDDWGWSRLCRQPPVVQRVPGSHGTLLMPPHVAAIAGKLGQR